MPQPARPARRVDCSSRRPGRTDHSEHCPSWGPAPPRAAGWQQTACCGAAGLRGLCRVLRGCWVAALQPRSCSRQTSSSNQPHAARPARRSAYPRWRPRQPRAKPAGRRGAAGVRLRPRDRSSQANARMSLRPLCARLIRSTSLTRKPCCLRPPCARGLIRMGSECRRVDGGLQRQETARSLACRARLAPLYPSSPARSPLALKPGSPPSTPQARLAPVYPTRRPLQQPSLRLPPTSPPPSPQPDQARVRLKTPLRPAPRRHARSPAHPARVQLPPRLRRPVAVRPRRRRRLRRFRRRRLRRRHGGARSGPVHRGGGGGGGGGEAGGGGGAGWGAGDGLDEAREAAEPVGASRLLGTCRD